METTSSTYANATTQSPPFDFIMFPFDSLPSEYHLPLIIAVAVIGLVAVVVFSQFATKPAEAAAKSPSKTPASPAPETPPRSSTRANSGDMGTTMTPSGRRSARIASRRKED